LKHTENNEPLTSASTANQPFLIEGHTAAGLVCGKLCYVMGYQKYDLLSWRILFNAFETNELWFSKGY
jgi:hypothetical protein